MAEKKTAADLPEWAKRPVSDFPKVAERVHNLLRESPGMDTDEAIETIAREDANRSSRSDG